MKGVIKISHFILIMVLLVEIVSAANVFGVSGTPLENFDVDTTTGMVKYRPLNMTWLNFAIGTSHLVTPKGITSTKTTGFTFSLWANTTGISNDYYNSYNGGGTTNFNLGLNGTGYLIIKLGSTGNYCKLTSSIQINDSKWHNLIFLAESNTTDINAVAIYIDGVQDSINATCLVGFSPTYSGDLYGRSIAGGIGASLDELRFYSNNISLSNILEINSSGRRRNDSLLFTNLKVYLPTNENQLKVIYDISGNANDFTGSSFPTWQSDNINVTTLGYPVNITLVNITKAWIIWDNGTTWNDSLTTDDYGNKYGNFDGNITVQFLNTQTLWVYENYNIPISISQTFWGKFFRALNPGTTFAVIITIIGVCILLLLISKIRNNKDVANI